MTSYCYCGARMEAPRTWGPVKAEAYRKANAPRHNRCASAYAAGLKRVLEMIPEHPPDSDELLEAVKEEIAEVGDKG